MKLPATIGKYRLNEFIGGWIGEVYLGVGTGEWRPVTVQLMPEGCRGTSEFMDRARAASELQHDNVIRTLAYGDENGQPIWVREYAEGNLLSEATDLGDLKAKVRIAIQVARGLQYLHGCSLVHGMVRPQSIHLAVDRVRLLDYESPGDGKTITGAPYYLAPEQLRGAVTTAASDVYAFGLLLYEILAGKRARIGLKTDEVMRQAIEGTIDYGALEGVPEELVTIVRQATIARAAERPPIGVAVTELDGWLSHQETVALAVEKKVVEEKVAEVVDPRPVKVPPMVPPRRVRVSFVRLVVVGMIVCMIGGLLVGMLGVKVANAYFTQPPLRVIP